jgi:hypothetical protein
LQSFRYTYKNVSSVRFNSLPGMRSFLGTEIKKGCSGWRLSYLLICGEPMRKNRRENAGKMRQSITRHGFFREIKFGSEPQPIIKKSCGQRSSENTECIKRLVCPRRCCSHVFRNRLNRLSKKDSCKCENWVTLKLFYLLAAVFIFIIPFTVSPMALYI